MLTLPSALLAAQKSAGNYRPSFSLSLEDNGRPHFSRWLAGGAADNHAAQDCLILPDGRLLRVQAAAGVLSSQLVSDPAASAQWMAAWSTIGGGFGPQLLLIETRILLVYFIQSGSPVTATLCCRYSDDNGVSWSPQAVIQTWSTVGYSQVDISAAGGGIFYIVSGSGIIYFRSYTIAGGWSAAVTSPDLSCVALAAVFIGSGSYRLLFSSLSASQPCLFSLAFNASTSAFSAVRELTNTGSPYYAFTPIKIIYAASISLYLAFAWVNEEEWQVAGSADFSSHRVFFSRDAEYWSDPLVVDTPSSRHIETAVSCGAAVYAPAIDGGLYRSMPMASVTELELCSYQFDLPDGELSAVVQIHDSAALTALLAAEEETAPLPLLTLQRGVDGLTVNLPPCYLYSWLWHGFGKGRFLSLKASALLPLHAAVENSVVLDGGILAGIVRFVCAIAGLAAAFDEAALWSMEAVISLPRGATAIDLLNRLAQEFAFAWRITASGAIFCWRPSEAAAAYAYGSASGEHRLLAASAGRALPAAVHYRYPDPTAGDQIGHQTPWPMQQQAAGFRALHYADHRAVMLAADRSALALALDLQEKENTWQAVLLSRPNFGLEIGDQVLVHGLGISAGYEAHLWRVLSIREVYRPADSIFHQLVQLRGGSS